MKRFFSYPISVQLVILLVATVVVSLLITGGILCYVSIDFQTKQIQATEQAGITAASEKINAYFDDLQRKLNYLARVPGLTKFPQPIQRNILEGLLRHNSAYEMVGITDERGKLLQGISQTDEVVPQDWMDTTAFRRAFHEQEDYVGSVELKIGQEWPSLILAVPVRDDQNKVDGMLFARINLKFLWSILDEIKAGNYGNASILDQRQYLIARSGGSPGTFVFDDLAQSPIGELINDPNNNSSTYRNDDNELVLATAQNINTTHWHIVFELPFTKVYAPLFELLGVLLVSLLASILICVLLGIRLAGYITQPLKTLTDTAGHLSHGELDARAYLSEVGMQNEFKILADTFNHMAVQLSDTINDLQEDIEKRKSAEETLHETMLQNSAILKTVTDGFWLVDPNTQRILEVNEAYCSMSRYDREEILQMTVLEFDTQERSDDVSRHIQRVKQLGGEIFETTHRRKDGSIYPMEISIQYLPETGKIFAFLRDISKRKEAESALRESEERFRLLAENSTDMISRHDLQGLYLYASPACRSLLGYEPAEMMGHSAFEFIHPEDIPVAEQSRTNIVDQPVDSTIAFRIRRKDGKYIWIETISHTILDSSGSPIEIHASSRDITKRKETEDALRENRNRYQLVFENSGTANAIFDLQYRLTMQNNLSAQHLGVKAGAAIGKTVIELFGPGQGPIIQERMRQVMDSGKPATFETEFNLPTGKKWFRTIYHPIYEDQHSLMGLQLISQDITEHKEAEEKLRESEQQFRHAVIESPIPMLIHDEDDNSLTISKGWTKYSGYTLDDIPTLGDWTRLAYGEQSTSAKEYINNLFEINETVNNGEWIINTANGEKRVWHFFTTPIGQNSDGKRILLSLAIDITERKQAEQALLVAEQEYRSIFENAPVGIFQSNLNGRFLKVNSTMAQIYGYDSPEEMLNSITNIAQQVYLTPSSRQEFQRLIQERGEVIEFKNQNIRKDKNIIWTSTNARSVTDDQGQILYYEGFIRDITAQKQAEEMLRESESKLRTMLDTMSEGMALNEIVYDENGEMIDYRILDVNSAFYKVADFTNMQVVGNVATKLYGMSVDVIKSFWKEHKERGEIQRTEFASPQTNKIYFVSTSPFVDDKFVTSFFDMTDLKNAEIALRESEEKFRSIFEEAPIGMGLLDSPNGRFLQVNPSYCKITGYTSDQLVGTHYRDITHPDDKEIDQKQKRELLSGRIPNYTFEKRYVRPDGSIVWAHLTIVAMWKNDSDPKIQLTMVEDITERKQAEEALRQSALQYSTILETMMDGFWLSDPVTLKILEVNEAYCRMSGYSREELLQLSIPELEAMEQPDDIALHARRLIEKGSDRFETMHRRKDGSTYPLEISVQHISETRKSFSFLRDITERKQAEEKIRQQLKRLNSLHTIDIAISSSFDLHTTLNIVLEQTASKLSVDACAVLLFNPHTQTLEHAASHGFYSNAIQHSRLRVGDGFAGRVVLERRTIHIPDLMETGGRLSASLQMANEQFTDYYGAPLIVKGEIKGVMEIYNRSLINPDSEWLAFLDTLATQTAIAIDNAKLFEGLQRSNFDLILAYDATIEGWSRALDLRDKETEGHTQRVTNLTVKLARQMGIPDSDIVHIRRGALLHDIGKMGIPDRILHKPDKLTEQEWDIMRQHTLHANDMLSPIIYLKPALEIPLYHHEKWDGSGYPYQMKGEQIPLAARIFAIVDVWDALTSERPYRKAWTREQAATYIQEQSGKHFDPLVVENFLKLISMI